MRRYAHLFVISGICIIFGYIWWHHAHTAYAADDETLIADLFSRITVEHVKQWFITGLKWLLEAVIWLFKALIGFIESVAGVFGQIVLSIIEAGIEFFKTVFGLLKT